MYCVSYEVFNKLFKSTLSTTPKSFSASAVASALPSSELVLDSTPAILGFMVGKNSAVGLLLLVIFFIKFA